MLQVISANHIRPFQHHTTTQLLNMLLVSKMCSYGWFVRNCNELLNKSIKLLGVETTVFYVEMFGAKVFSAGDTEDRLLDTINFLKLQGQGAIIDYCAEGESSEESLIQNEEGFKQSIKIAAKASDSSVAIKCTGLINSNLLAKLNGIQAQLESGSEENRFLNRYKNSIFLPDSPFYYSKLEYLTPSEKSQVADFISRVRRIVEYGIENGILVMIDAEQTYFQAAIDSLTVALQCEYNLRHAWVMNTFQSYLKDSQDNVKGYLAFTRDREVRVGVKLVRGAYMNEEKSLATIKGIANPVHDIKTDTDLAYNNNLRNIFEVLRRGDNLCVASHNEGSVHLAQNLMLDNRIDKRFGGVCFAQLLGMQAMMSTQLALQHYKVKKYVPFGPTSKLLPYLTRRAAESHEVVSKIEEQISQVMTELMLRSE